MKSLCGDSRRYQNGLRASTYKKNDGYPKDHPESRDSINCRSVDLHRGEKGQTTVVMALFMATFLCGFIALGIDVQSLFNAKRMAQSAADAAAVAAAEEASNGSQAEQTAANAAAKLNGFDTTLATNPATVTLSVPSGGDYSGSSSYLQVVVSKPVPTFFMDVINTKFATMTVSGRAVSAAGQSSPTCICLQGTSGTDLTISGGSSMAPTGCGTSVDSTSNNAVVLSGGASLSGPSLGIASTTWTESSEVSGGASISASTHIVQGVDAKCSPPLPTVPTYNAAQCTNDPSSHYGGNASYSLGPGSNSTYTTTQTGSVVCYNSLTVGSGNQAVNLNSGIYVINGGQLNFHNGANNEANTGGNSVFFYLTGGASLTVSGGANVNLTAPVSGTYSGILLFQDPSDTQNMTISGGSNSSVNGAIYAPKSAVTISGGSGVVIDADVDANTLTVTGGGTLNSNPITNFGTLNTSVAKITE